MPCDAIYQQESMIQSFEAKAREARLAKLASELKSGSARIVRRGLKVEIIGWSDRGEICDACAIRSLSRSSDFAIRRLVQLAGAIAKGVVYGHTH